MLDQSLATKRRVRHLVSISDAVAEMVNIPKKHVRRVLDLFIKEIVSSLNDGLDVRLAGLGSLRCKSLPAREIKHPATQEIVKTGPSRRITFKAQAGVFSA